MNGVKVVFAAEAISSGAEGVSIINVLTRMETRLVIKSLLKKIGLK